ncbi:MAG: response regulator [Proteobacteria bacterium]|nr:response regulator [Pseudomonadota bacterium]NOG61288.1 response regulator [Pseudomonadota bacterium]
MLLSFKKLSEKQFTSTIMIIDDQASSLDILAETLKNIDEKVLIKPFQYASEALKEVKKSSPDLIITDYRMPVMNGIEFTKKLRRIPGCKDIPIMMITIMKDRAILYEALENGVNDFLNKPFDKTEYKSKCKNLLSLAKHQSKLKRRSQSLTKKINASSEEIHIREQETLDRLTKACAYKDCVTGAHLERIGRISYIIALELGLNESNADILRIASPLHDIGKIAIPDEILLKRGKLTEFEFKKMKTHTTIGYDILKDSPSPYLQTGALIALNHHEKYNGTGYPYGISANDIPIEARIVAVADVFDSLTNHRPYKAAWSLDKTINYIKSEKGKHLDPDCVEALLEKTDDITT